MRFLKTNLWWIIAIIVVAVVALWFVGNDARGWYNPTPTPSPTASPSPTPCVDEGWNEVQPCETASPSPTESPSATPTATQTNDKNDDHPLKDQNSCTIKDCSTHPTVTLAPCTASTCGWK